MVFPVRAKIQVCDKVADGSSRIRPGSSLLPAKPPPPPPREKGGATWQKMYEDAVAANHPEPEKLADSMLRSREKALELKDARAKVIVTTIKPKAAESSAVEKTGRKTLPAASRCKACTLSGKQCGFKATKGPFCSKHSCEKI
jgi:hypothetical protein